MTTALSALAEHTTLDYDFNILSLTDWPEKVFHETFTDCTSNQALVYNGIVGSEHKERILKEAVTEAKELITTDADGAQGRKSEEVAIDIIAIKLALPIFKHLRGFIHSQTSILAANSLSGTLSHAKNLLALYKHYGIPNNRLCLKIPATVEGLEACRRLEKEGITTLATVVHSEAQIVAAGEAGCTYVAPYINPLAVHFVEGAYKDLGPHGLDGYTIAARGQATFKARGIATKTMAASIVTPTEALCLAGLSHSTLAPSVLLALNVPITPAQTALIAQSVAFYSSAEPYDFTGDVKEKMDESPTNELVQSALEIFGGFEEKLLQLAKEDLAKN